MGISAALGSSALLPGGLGFRNKIINGDMRIAQRGTGAVTGSGSIQFPVDRWGVFNGTGTVTFQQSTDAPAGFTNSIVATNSSTPGSYSNNGYTQITQRIEGFNCQDLGYGTSWAKRCVLSFWVKSSVTGIQNVSFKNSANNRVYVAKYTINTANTWEQKVIIINGDTTGTWVKDNGMGIEITFNIGMGTDFDTTSDTWLAQGAKYSTSDAVDFAANANATFYLTGVQFEQNIQATPFEFRPYGTELALCQRYYYRITTPTGVSNGYLTNFGNVAYNANSADVLLYNPVPMRAPATGSVDYSNLGLGDDINATVTGIVPRAINAAYSTANTTLITFDKAAGFTTRYYYALIAQSAGSYIGVGAEL